MCAKNNFPTSQAGFIALLSVVLAGALVLTISIGISLRSVGSAQMSIGQEQSHRALALADLCAEQALMKLESVLDYAGEPGAPIMIDGESCEILAVEGSGNFNRTVKTQSAVSGYTKKIRIQVSQVSPIMQIASWEEVADF